MAGAHRKSSRAIAALLIACASLAAAAPVAQAGDFDGDPLAKLEQEMAKLREKGRWAESGKLTEALAACNDTSYEQPFLPWGDPADYVLVPEGTLETSDAWTLKKKAAVVPYASPFYSGSSGDGYSLFLPSGSEAITPPMCITELHPTIRLFVANSDEIRQRLVIEVLYEDLGGKIKKLKIAKLRGNADWQPSLPVLIQANVRALGSENGIAVVAFRFTVKDDKDLDASQGYIAGGDAGFVPTAGRTLAVPAGETGWYIDDVFVDPFRAR